MALMNRPEMMDAEQAPPSPEGAPPQGQPAQPQAPAGADVQDTSGGGGAQIGTGTAPAPGEQGFTGNV